MRIVIAKRHGRRGEGLGNELLPFAKGWLASQALDAHLVGPSWGINKRRYYRNFSTPRFDFLCEDALLRLPHHNFTEADYRATGVIDFGEAIKTWAVERGLIRNRSFLVSVGGMWGGYPAIWNARAFLLAKLLGSRDALRNVYQVSSTIKRRDLFIAVHMRTSKNEFLSLTSDESPRGKFNILIPGEWYLWVCEQLHKHFHGRIHFHFFTDRGGPDFDEAVRRFNPGQIAQHGLTECSDLLLMAQADLRVCSISSYSLMASFLAGGPYLWYKPQLTPRNGLLTLWGNENSQQHPDSLSSQSVEFISNFVSTREGDHPLPLDFLGSTMDVGDPLPDSLLTLLEQRLRINDPRANLLEYGCIAETLR